mmetsp:Transcript_16732/g.38622  ORF Transcript_16732/g.38622 Transcript_16732/m.38622 type:complete len:348 (+) Transcript_16732:96-1139(+)
MRDTVCSRLEPERVPRGLVDGRARVARGGGRVLADRLAARVKVCVEGGCLIRGLLGRGRAGRGGALREPLEGADGAADGGGRGLHSRRGQLCRLGKGPREQAREHERGAVGVGVGVVVHLAPVKRRLEHAVQVVPAVRLELQQRHQVLLHRAGGGEQLELGVPACGDRLQHQQLGGDHRLVPAREALQRGPEVRLGLGDARVFALEHADLDEQLAHLARLPTRSRHEGREAEHRGYDLLLALDIGAGDPDQLLLRTHRRHQRRVRRAVAARPAAPLGEHRAHHLHVAASLAQRVVVRRVAVPILGEDVELLLLEQEDDRLDVPVGGREVEGCATIVVTEVGVAAEPN